MTNTMAPVNMTFKQHKFIVDLTAKRPNWIVQLTGEVYETVADVLVNEQIVLEAQKGSVNPAISKAISIKAASKAIDALLKIKPSETVAVTVVPDVQPQTLKQVATKWINEAAQPAPLPIPPPAVTPTVAGPTPLQRMRQLVKLLPDGPHMKFALTNDKGVVEFFSLDEAKFKSGTGTYRTVRKLLGSPGDWQRGYLSVHQQLDVMRQLLRYGWEQGCKDYAEKHGRCFRCDAHLSDERSRAAKMGKHCAQILGWPW